MRRREFLSGSVSLVACLMSRPARALVARAEDAAQPLPDYYGAYLDGIAAKVNARAKRSVDGFWFITDLHISANQLKSGRAIAALTAKTPGIVKTFCGGDLPEAFSQKKFESPKAGVDYAADAYRLFWVDPIEASGQRVYTARGNHDFTIRLGPGENTGLTYSAAETHRVVMGSKGCQGAEVVVNRDDPAGCYYFFDNAAAKIRYVVADTTDSYDTSRNWWAVRSGIGETQLRWLADKAIATIPDGWNAVVIHHIPITGCVGVDSEEKTYANFRRLLEAYQSRSKIALCGKAYDFAKAGGRIFLDITGHHHAERQTFRNGILYVTEPCDAVYGDYIIGSAPWCGDLPRKRAGSPVEQTFDAVQLDPAHDLVYFTRVGGGQDRVIHAKALTAKVGAPLACSATQLKGPLTWGCYDADRIAHTPNPKSRYNPFVTYFNEVATVDAKGVFTAKKPGESMVIAMDANLNKEIWPVLIEA